MKVQKILKKEVYPWLLTRHYAHRIPSISYAFGLFEKELMGICTFGSPPSPSLCKGVCGEEYKQSVIELNRLCLEEELPKNSASFFVGKCLKMLPPQTIVVSYADTSMNHHGYIYQATNFIYTGLSDKRTEWRKRNSSLHSKTICESVSLEERKASDDYYVTERPRKHRYIYFIGSKRWKKQMRKELNYPIYPYPKGDNIRYNASGDIEKQGELPL